MKTIVSAEEFEDILAKKAGVLAYFSHDRCNVCKTLKPKIEEYFTERFSEIELVYVNTENLPDIAGKYSIFTVPVILIFFDGRETYRKARSIGVQELGELVRRPYSMIFE
jgi:thioredoxin-like negative regulator of GroEL